MRWARGYALVGALVVAGCSSPGPEPAANSVPSAVSSPTYFPMTSAPPASDPVAGLPTAARQRTAAGAESFVRYFVELLNRSATNPSADPFGPLAGAGCRLCSSVSADSQQLLQTGARYRRSPLRVSSVGGHPEDPAQGGSYFVSAILIQDAVDVIDRTGAVLRRTTASTQSYDFELVWGPGHWQLKGAGLTPAPADQ